MSSRRATPAQSVRRAIGYPRETSPVTDKAALRSRIAADRRARPEQQRSESRAAIRAAVLDHLGELELPAGARIAAYQPLASEPGSEELLAQLDAAGFEVIVPITLPDRDLDWGRWGPAGAELVPLGRSAIASAAVILVPAFAVDRTGRRLGRGGGSYDRALARAAAGATVAALLFAPEVLDAVPTDDWDVPVDAIVTEQGWQPVG